MTVRVIVTGGTFDKEYDELRGTLNFRQSHVAEMLQRGRCHLDVTIFDTNLVRFEVNGSLAKRNRIYLDWGCKRGRLILSWVEFE